MSHQIHTAGLPIEYIAFIDPSCISELGRDWERYYTATRAAAAGGITTLMGMVYGSYSLQCHIFYHSLQEPT